jgi:hypothetical protein
MSGYQIYCKERMDSPEYNGLNSKDKIAAISERWRTENQQVKSKYNLIHAQQLDEYTRKMEEYNKERHDPIVEPLTWDSVRRRGMFEFARQNLDKIKKKVPGVFEHELRQVVCNEYHKLSATKKVCTSRCQINTRHYYRKYKDGISPERGQEENPTQFDHSD